MKQQIQSAIEALVRQLYDTAVQVELSRPEVQFGDYATNVALQLAKSAGQNPRQLAETLAAALRPVLADIVSEVSVAGPGFINLRLTDAGLVRLTAQKPSKPYAGQTVVTEYSDPNPFKVLHVGHLYTSVVGDAISNLLEAAGGMVHRTNFGGDVGLHVGKTMWAIIDEFGGENPDKLAQIPVAGRAEWMAQAYVRGTQAYDDDQAAKQTIVTYNKRVYEIHASGDHDSAFAQIYWTCRQWSYEYFDAFYERIHTPFEKYYPESQTAPLGVATVRSHLADGIYEESDGAVVFKGEAYDLHTRVFINSNGLPTYEAKDVGLLMCKWRDYEFDLSVVITGNDITEYMKVVLKSVEQFEPQLVARSRHVPHGNVKLAGGVKMSSRKGNFLRAVDVLEMVAAANASSGQDTDDNTVLGAVKYAFLRQRIGADIIFSPEESVSLEGNSGPYLQYAHARACSVLRKAGNADAAADLNVMSGLQPDERNLLRKLSEYAEIVDRAVEDLMPHYVCTYLYELAQDFNRFYEKNLVVGHERQLLRTQLVKLYVERLAGGLRLLGIHAPVRM